ncbi:MAG: hypothetical protein HYY17_08720 [Planctomycetes bacterium]|nr:hypothetical protein [Planctomycetota bacterium]
MTLRESAADGLGLFPREISVPALIAACADRPAPEPIFDALRRITGQSFGPDLDAWRAWWRRTRKRAPVPAAHGYTGSRGDR